MNARRKFARATAKRAKAEARERAERLCALVAGLAGGHLSSWGIDAAKDVLLLRVEREGLYFDLNGSYRAVANDPHSAARDMRRQMDEQIAARDTTADGPYQSRSTSPLR